eukprot:477336-Amphidinium_carterae.1
MSFALQVALATPCGVVTNLSAADLVAVEEHFRPLGQVVPALIGSLQSLANEGQEQSLKEVLEALSQAIDEEAACKTGVTNACDSS